MRCGRGRGALFGWMRGRRHRRHGSTPPAERVEHALGQFESRLAITEAQREDWEALAGMIRDGAEALGVAGPANGVGAGQTALEAAPDRLARLEAKVEAGLAILRRTRPAFERLYDRLDETQRGTLDALIAKSGFRPGSVRA